MHEDPLGALAERLRCPHCGQAMTCDARVVRCVAGHAFDRSRGGGVTLLAPPAALPLGDTPAMLEARAAFLGAGHYAPLTAAIAAAVPSAARWIVDAGAGTGHHTAGALDAHPAAVGLALDAAKTATRRAARAHPRLAAVACDITGVLPLRDRSADALLSVFSPRNPEEFARVLAPDGLLVVVSAADDHLVEARTPLGLLGVQPEKRAKLHARLSPALLPVALRSLRFALSLDRDALVRLAGMGPAAFHHSPDEIAARVAEIEAPLTVAASVTVETFALG